LEGILPFHEDGSLLFEEPLPRARIRIHREIIPRRPDSLAEGRPALVRGATNFVKALHEGVGRDGKHLYPAFPYTSYTLMTRSDVLAVKAYLFSLKAGPEQTAGQRHLISIQTRNMSLAGRDDSIDPAAVKASLKMARIGVAVLQPFRSSPTTSK
jgi:hypothetical protein